MRERFIVGGSGLKSVNQADTTHHAVKNSSKKEWIPTVVTTLVIVTFMLFAVSSERSHNHRKQAALPNVITNHDLELHFHLPCRMASQKLFRCCELRGPRMKANGLKVSVSRNE